jgi:hypothetical protein
MHLRACRGEGARRIIGASEADNLVAAAEEFGHDRGADKAGRAGNEYAHEKAS